MATRSIKPKRDDSLLAGWETVPERAPSETVAEQPTMARIIGFFALLLATIGSMALLAPVINWRYLINPSWGVFFLSLGTAGLLYHAFRDADEQFRRLYALFAIVLLGAGVLMRVIPIKEEVGALFLPVGLPCLGAALLFLLAVLRNETETSWRTPLLALLGGAGVLACVACFVIGNISQDFLLREGVLFGVLGLLYLGGCIGTLGSNSDAGYRIALALGILGGIAFFVALGRSIFGGPTYLVPGGLALMTLGLLYAAVSVLICSDSVFIVLVRRELLAFFYSPIAYLVIIGLVIIAGFQFSWFLALVVQRGGAIEEPIVSGFRYMNFLAFVSINFMVPAITMRLLSEERRTGTLEVLLTAPLNEATIVLSKFVATWIFFMIAVSPWWLNLVAMRVMGGSPFDYRPILSFMIALAVTGAGFTSMGLFFSSVTKNQIIAAVLTFAGMLGLTSIYLGQLAGPPWREILAYASFIHLWESSLEGIFAPRLLLFHVSMAVFFLFLTTKVLEARKWS